MPGYIYGLRHPDTKVVYYVGQTVYLDKRNSRHVNNPHSRPLKLWVNKLKENGLEPEMFILETVTKGNLYDFEDKWINHGRANGWPLLNSGGKPEKKSLSIYLDPDMDAQLFKVTRTYNWEYGMDLDFKITKSELVRFILSKNLPELDISELHQFVLKEHFPDF